VRPVIRANGDLSFEDELRSGGLLADSVITLGEPRDGWVSEKEQFELLDTSSSSKRSWGAVVEFAGE
jgi:hypothetical protein